MFGTSILDYRARLQIAKHGFESVTLKLARDYDRYKAIAERHGIEISARRVRHVLDQVEREREKLSAWRRVLELTNSALLRNSPPADGAAARASQAADADRRHAQRQIRTRFCRLSSRPSSSSASARISGRRFVAQQPRADLLLERAGLVVAGVRAADREPDARRAGRRPSRGRGR